MEFGSLSAGLVGLIVGFTIPAAICLYMLQQIRTVKRRSSEIDLGPDDGLHGDVEVTGPTGWFQGSASELIDHDARLEIQGTYCIYTMRLSPEQFSVLDEIFVELAKFQVEGHMPGVFFGIDEDAPEYLAISLEPAGIQINGRLKPEQWRSWDEAFRALVDRANLPRFPA